MAEQQKNQPPDLSPTDMPHPSRSPVGRYTYLSMADRYGLQPAYGIKPLDMRYKTDADGQGQHADTAASNPSKELDLRRPQHSIEDLLQGVWRPTGSPDMVAGLFHDRLQAQTLELSDVLEQIKQRLDIYQKHFDELEQAKLDVTNVRHHWLDPIRRNGVATDPDLVSAIEDFNAQQRQERLSCWKDLSSLRQQVPEHWRQYLNAARQYHLIDAQELGGRSNE